MQTPHTKIIICTNHFHPSVGGCQIVTQKIANHLHNNNYQVHILTRKLKGRNPSNYPYQVLEYNPTEYNEIKQKIDDIKPDIVFVYSDVFDYFRHIMCDTNRFKLIVALCGANWIYSGPNNANIVYRHNYNIHQFILHGKEERDYRFCTSKEFIKKTTIIPNGVDLSEFDNNDLIKENLLPGKKYHRWILNVSNFFPGKGQDFLIPILNQVKTEKLLYIQVFNDIEFPIGAQLETQWRKNITKLKNIEVSIQKNISREKIIGFFKNSNVFAYTSQKEVAPIVLLEAQAAKLPWIATNVGNAQSLKGGKSIAAIKDGKFNSIFDDRVKKLFSETIDQFLVNPTIADAGRQQIEQEMNWDLILPQYLKLFDQYKNTRTTHA